MIRRAPEERRTVGKPPKAKPLSRALNARPSSRCLFYFKPKRRNATQHMWARTDAQRLGPACEMLRSQTHRRRSLSRQGRKASETRRRALESSSSSTSSRHSRRHARFMTGLEKPAKAVPVRFPFFFFFFSFPSRHSSRLTSHVRRRAQRANE